MKLQRNLKSIAAIFTLLCATVLLSLPAAAAGAKSPAARPAKLMLQEDLVASCTELPVSRLKELECN